MPPEDEDNNLSSDTTMLENYMEVAAQRAIQEREQQLTFQLQANNMGVEYNDDDFDQVVNVRDPSWDMGADQMN